MKRYRLKCQAFEFEVATDDGGVITDAPPLAAKFLNQNITALTRWLEGLGLADCCRIEESGRLFE